MSGVLPTGTRKQRKSTRAGPQKRRRRRRRGRERETGRENTGAQKRREELPVAYTKALQKRAPGTNQEQLQNKKRSFCPKTFQKPPRNKNKTPKKKGLKQGELFSGRFRGRKRGISGPKKPSPKTPDSNLKAHCKKPSEKKHKTDRTLTKRQNRRDNLRKNILEKKRQQFPLNHT